jgi:hypothetical protein
MAAMKRDMINIAHEYVVRNSSEDCSFNFMYALLKQEQRSYLCVAGIADDDRHGRA